MVKIEMQDAGLVWPGRYNSDGSLRETRRVQLPFQVIETINESRISRDTTSKQATLYDIWEGNEAETFEEGWKNKLVWGDNLLVAGSLFEKFAGQVDLIYIDPPFATGADFRFKVQVGDGAEGIVKDHSVLEEKAYRDTWGRGLESYFQMMYERLVLLKDLLSDNGSIYVHLDWRVAHYIKVIMDSIFGYDNFQREIIWWPNNVSGFKGIAPNWIRDHETLLYYSKTKERVFNKSYQEYSPEYVTATFVHDDHDGKGKYRWRYERKQYADESKGVPTSDVWDIPYLRQNAIERVGFDTQKPLSLLKRIILASSNEGDLVADFFCGSGTTLVAAEMLGRRWIGCDLSKWAINVTRKRLVDFAECKPFELLNLGKYERGYWQDAKFGDMENRNQQGAFLRYVAFILRLYGAEPLKDKQHIHGKKGRAMVHVGAVDAPVTIDEISNALVECSAHNQTELHILGWEWEMGLVGPSDEHRGGLMYDMARQRGIKLRLLQIPREVMEQQAVDKGDIRFFELAYVDVRIEVNGKRVMVTLTDFIVPNTDLIPDDVNEKIEKWSDYVDYWAIDWDFQNDSFNNGWLAYRTKKQRSLCLISKPHTYTEAGTYRLLVKVVDIFGNDTTREFDVEV